MRTAAEPTGSRRSGPRAVQAGSSRALELEAHLEGEAHAAARHAARALQLGAHAHARADRHRRREAAVVDARVDAARPADERDQARQQRRGRARAAARPARSARPSARSRPSRSARRIAGGREEALHALRVDLDPLGGAHRGARRSAASQRGSPSPAATPSTLPARPRSRSSRSVGASRCARPAARAGPRRPAPRILPASRPAPPATRRSIMRTRTAVLSRLGFALLVGFTLTGPLLYKSLHRPRPVGLPGRRGDPVAGAARGPRARRRPRRARCWRSGRCCVAGVVALPLRARRARRRGRRLAPRFLTGAGAGVGRGARLGGRWRAPRAPRARSSASARATSGWAPVGDKIIDRSVAFTHPEWKESWKGSRIQAHRRFGRTGWNVSDIVLGTGRISGENGEQIARARARARRQLLRHRARLLRLGQRAGDGPRDEGRARPALRRHQVLHADGPPADRHAGARATSRRSRAACARLGTDYVDLCPHPLVRRGRRA